MKNFIHSLLILSLILLISCGGEQKQGKLPVVDVTKTYPKKEIILQDIAEVEYIPLETRDYVLIDRSRSIVYISEDIIVIHNKKQGDIFFFDGQGKFLSKFNRKGQGGEEYIRGPKAVFDGLKKELFVYDRHKNNIRIQVYDVKGIYKRTLSVKLKNLGTIVDYNEENLLAYEPYWNFSRNNRKEEEEKNLTPFMLISKETGHVDTLKEFENTDRVSSLIWQEKGNRNMAVFFAANNIVPLSANSFMLDNFSADTIFDLSQGRKLTPVCVKTPSLKAQGSKIIFTQVLNASKKWLFLQKQFREFDFESQKPAKQTSLLVDRATKSINEYTLSNKEISDAEFKVIPTNKLLNSDELVGLLEEGKLSGKLKAIAENLKEDDNPVLVKVKLKNN